MATFSAIHPTLSLHLTDPALTPILTSSLSDSQASSSNVHSRNLQYRALNDLTTASATVYTSSARLGLGLPQRIMIETSKTGPVVLHSFLNPQANRRQTEVGKLEEGARSGSGTAGSLGGVAGHVLDQTREALRPVSASTVDNEELDAHKAGSASKDKAAHDDDGAISPGAFGPETLANGQPVLNGMETSKGKDLQLHGGELSEHHSPPSTTAAAVTDGGEEEEEGQSAPLLIATVVAPMNDSEARRAVTRLERLGREFQHKFREQQIAEKQMGREGEEDSTVDG